MNQTEADQSRKVDFIRDILEAVLDAVTEDDNVTLNYRAQHAVQHMEGYSNEFREGLTYDNRKRLIKMTETFYRLWKEKGK